MPQVHRDRPLLTRNEPYGFAVEVDLPELYAGRRGGGPTAPGRSFRECGVSIVSRPYASTPEAIGERQPIEDGRTLLLYEGRVDNRQDVASALGRPELAGAADGAVLQAAYDAWGPELSGRVVGEYAFCVIDVGRRRLVAGQDSLGVRRLFYRASGDVLWVASNPSLLFEQFPQARTTIDPDALGEYFAGVMAPWSGLTIWRGLRELRRGSVLVQRGERRVGEERAWRMAETPGGRRLTDPEVDEGFRTLLADAVRGALRSPGPVLCDLSGGFDSSAVCSVAAQQERLAGSKRRFIAWSVVRESDDDASRVQAEVCKSCGIDWHPLAIADHPPFDRFTDTEIPTGGFVQSGAIYDAMRAFAHAHGIRARLTGQGADALLHKGRLAPVYLAEWLRRGRVRDWARHVLAYLANGSFNLWHLLTDCTVGTLDMHAATVRHPMPDWVTRAFRRRIREAADSYARTERMFGSDARERVYRSTLAFMPYNGSMLPDERMPLVYRPLVEFLLSLDWVHLVRPGEDRVVMRRALADVLPQTVQRHRVTSRHSVSLIDGFRAAWPTLAPLLTGDRLAELGVVERKGFADALNQLRVGHEGPNRQFTMTAVYLELWLALKDAGRATARRIEGPALISQPV